MYSAIETLAEPHPVSFLVSVLDPRFQEYKKLVRAISLSRDFFNLFFFLVFSPFFLIWVRLFFSLSSLSICCGDIRICAFYVQLQELLDTPETRIWRTWTQTGIRAIESTATGPAHSLIYLHNNIPNYRFTHIYRHNGICGRHTKKARSFFLQHLKQAVSRNTGIAYSAKSSLAASLVTDCWIQDTLRVCIYITLHSLHRACFYIPDRLSSAYFFFFFEFLNFFPLIYNFLVLSRIIKSWILTHRKVRRRTFSQICSLETEQ